MISSTAIANDLATFFMPIGLFGAGIAVLCAVIAMVALAGDAVGVAGGAIGVWIVGAMLSLAAGFADAWLPLGVAVVSMVAALVIGSVVRSVRGSLRRRAA